MENLIRMSKKQKKGVTETLLAKYRYLAKSYSHKLYNYERLGLQQEDIQQELEIRLYEAICAYGRRWAAFKKGEARQPMPIEYYLRLAMKNRLKDFMSKIDISVPENSFTDIGSVDIQQSQINSDVDLEKDRAIINHVDLYVSLEGNDRHIWTMHLKGYPMKDIVSKYGLRAKRIVTQQCALLCDKIELREIFNQKKQVVQYFES